jgi:glyoxylate reductase
MQEGKWAGWAPTAFMGGRVGGKRLGILGMGRIGQAVASARRPSGCRCITTTAAGYMPISKQSLEARYWESLDQMIARMDVISA